MSPSEGFDDDEYVAKLLAEDAKKSSIKYSTHGLQALLPRRPTTAAPRPNTRFLKSIVREADSHNAALKRKEELEARIRLRRIKEGRRKSTNDSHHDDTRRTKRRRCSAEDDTVWRRQERDQDVRNTRSEMFRSGDKRHHGTRRDEDRRPERGSHVRSRDDEKKKRRRRRSQSPSHESSMEDDEYDKSKSNFGQHTKRRRRRSLEGSTGSESLSDSGKRKPQSSRKNGHVRDKSKPSGSRVESHRAQESPGSARASSESDPLETLVGPLDRPKQKNPLNDPPPIRSRGRGAYKPSAAAMDAHFSADYNPNLDLHPESEVEDEKEDWDMALEAHRDREMFKQKHAERLREAGFGDAEIKKWEDSGKEKNVEEVQWSSKGQAREWDVGKVQQDAPPAKLNSGMEAAWRR